MLSGCCNIAQSCKNVVTMLQQQRCQHFLRTVPDGRYFIFFSAIRAKMPYLKHLLFVSKVKSNGNTFQKPFIARNVWERFILRQASLENLDKSGEQSVCNRPRYLFVKSLHLIRYCVEGSTSSNAKQVSTFYETKYSSYSNIGCLANTEYSVTRN